MKFQLRFCFFDVLGFESSVDEISVTFFLDVLGFVSSVAVGFFGSFQRECVLATWS